MAPEAVIVGKRGLTRSICVHDVNLIVTVPVGVEGNLATGRWCGCGRRIVCNFDVGGRKRMAAN